VSLGLALDSKLGSHETKLSGRLDLDTLVFVSGTTCTATWCLTDSASWHCLFVYSTFTFAYFLLNFHHYSIII